jgi:hypothetical protein
VVRPPKKRRRPPPPRPADISRHSAAGCPLERAWAAGPRGSGLAVRVAKIYEARNRDADAEKVLKEAIVRHPDDKAAHHMLALHYLRQEQFDPNIVEQHLRSSFSVGDHNFEERLFWPSSSFTVAR